MDSSLGELFGRLGPVRAVDRVSSGSPAVLALVPGPDGLRGMQTIDATFALARRHARLIDAKRAVEAVMEQGYTVIALGMVEDMGTLLAELARAGFAVEVLDSASAQLTRFYAGRGVGRVAAVLADAGG